MDNELWLLICDRATLVANEAPDLLSFGATYGG